MSKPILRDPSENLPAARPDDAPTADLIFITHAHHDHLRPEEIERLRTRRTDVIAPRDVAGGLTGNVTAVEPDHETLVAALLTALP